MSLKEYRRKRDFTQTPEPNAKSGSGQGNLFVIQKHDATRLHYDFRLEMNGVLASWAVPKGPSLDPAEKRLAVQVEDHPLGYAKFEGVIPEGEYGGGPVLVWDQGEWFPQGDPVEGLREGKLKFQLEGQKLHGGWTLVRMADRQRRGSKPNWLLIKERDASAKPTAKTEIVDRLPRSILSGRTIEEIAVGKSGKRLRKNNARRSIKSRTSAHPAVRSNRRVVKKQRHDSKGRAAISARNPKRPVRARDLTSLAKDLGARERSFPRSPKSQLATAVTDPPEGDEWFHELKLDGYRMFCSLRNGQVQFTSRRGNDWTVRLKSLVAPVNRLQAESAVLDGEVVVLDEHGMSSFQALQNAFRGESNKPLIYYAFDLLYLNGYEMTSLPLEARKNMLEQLLVASPDFGKLLCYSEHIIGSGSEFLRQVCNMQLEGVISKRRDAPYLPGRGYDWVKSKCRMEQEFVIGGFTKPSGSRLGFGALLLGYFGDDGKFIYAGRVGTGFDTRLLRELSRQLKEIKQPISPFAEIPHGISTRGVTWVKPKLVAQVQFNNWTEDNLLRQAAFLGLREDKSPREIRREVAKKPPK